jgi:hypothetical protein
MWEVTTNVPANDTQEFCVYFEDKEAAWEMVGYLQDTGHNYAIMREFEERHGVPMYTSASGAFADFNMGHYDKLVFRDRKFNHA